MTANVDVKKKRAILDLKHCNKDGVKERDNNTKQSLLDSLSTNSFIELKTRFHWLTAFGRIANSPVIGSDVVNRQKHGLRLNGVQRAYGKAEPLLGC